MRQTRIRSFNNLMAFSFYKPFGWLVTVIGLILLTLFTLAMGRMPAVTLTNTPTIVPTLVQWPTPTPNAVAQDVPAGGAMTTLTGVVIDDAGPVAGATVRLHLNPKGTTSASDGTFTLVDLPAATVFTVTAWADGYYINWQRVTAVDTPVHMQLHPIYTTDNVEYDWFEEDGIEGSLACGTCHTAYTEWQQDAHSQTATNYRFTNMY